MGIEDFGVLLRPTQPLPTSLVEGSLFKAGFMRSTGSALSRQFTYVLSDETRNIEALLTQNPQDDALVGYMSVRYAICQPAAATQTFLDIVAQLTEKFCFQITGIAPGVEFSCETLDKFRDFTIKRVMQAKSRWSSLFAGDTEEVVLSVADSWKYFSAKHPKALQSDKILAG